MEQIEINIEVNPKMPGCDLLGAVRNVERKDPELGNTAQLSDPLSDNGNSLFLPCNREDALLLLGSLCISEFFPDSTVRLALQPEGIALVEQGLRSSEENLINGGQAERFPVLIEVGNHIQHRSPRVVTYGDIRGLVFRTQSDAEDFRFRPVDEFDTETFSCRAEESVFGLLGDARFSIRDVQDQSRLNSGRIADRLAAGVHCLLAVGHARPDCRVVIADFLSRKPKNQLSSEGVDFAAVADILLDTQSKISFSKHQRAIVSAFASFDGTSARALIERVANNFLTIPGGENNSERIESRWVEIAGEVLKSRIALNGDHLADDKSVLLRGALLGLVADKIDSLYSFLDAENPSGPRVTATAAFFVGLKQGILNLSWQEKKANLESLSLLASLLIGGIANSPDKLAAMISVSQCETETMATLSISAGSLKLADWNVPQQVPPDDLSQLWIDEFKLFGYEMLGQGRSKYSWRLRLSPGHEVEMKHTECGGHRFPVLRFYIENGRKLRKPKELIELSRCGGMFWYPGEDEEGVAVLSCDLLVLPEDPWRELIVASLEGALDTFLLPAKAQRQSRKKKEETAIKS